MAFVIIVSIVGILALITGGSLKNLKNIRFKLSGLVLIALLIKIITNTDLRYSLGISDVFAPVLYSSSLALITLFILFNMRLRGLALVGLGLMCNLLAIISNGGYMPVKSEYLYFTSTAGEMDKFNQGLPVYNYIATGPHTKLYYLSDILLMPNGILISKVFSVGDVLITIGGSIFIWTYLRVRMRPTRHIAPP